MKFGFEILLLILNIVVWLGPIISSIRKGIFHPLHPQFMTPIFMIYFIINALLQKWLVWMLGTRIGMLKTTHENLLSNPDYLILPLIFVALAAPFYHYGVKITTKIMVKSGEDRSLLLKEIPVINPSNKLPFCILGFITCAICWIPNYLLPNEGYGTFWTFPLALTSSFLPFMLYKISKPVGLLSFGSSIVAGFILKSKASFLFPLLPIFFYYTSTMKINSFFSFFKPKILITIITFFSLSISLLSFGGFGIDYIKLLHRDYSFEVFAAIVDKAPITGVVDGPVTSWTLAEIKEGIPSFLWPGKKYSTNPAKLVSAEFLPHDYAVQPFTYFNRFLLFSGYYDLGLIGALLSAFGFGAFYGFLWRKTKNKILKTGYLWPLFIYITVPAIAVYFITSGGISYGIINASVPSAMMLLLLLFSKFITKVVKITISKITY